MLTGSGPRVVDEVVHHCVTNMPGMVQHASPLPYDTTQDYIIRLANERVEELIRKEPPY